VTEVDDNTRGDMAQESVGGVCRSARINNKDTHLLQSIRDILRLGNIPNIERNVTTHQYPTPSSHSPVEMPLNDVKHRDLSFLSRE